MRKCGISRNRETDESQNILLPASAKCIYRCGVPVRSAPIPIIGEMLGRQAVWLMIFVDMVQTTYTQPTGRETRHMSVSIEHYARRVFSSSTRSTTTMP